jgi:hypothetical protein
MHWVSKIIASQIGLGCLKTLDRDRCGLNGCQPRCWDSLNDGMQRGSIWSHAGLNEKGFCMRSFAKIATATALTTTLAFATATPSQAQWYGPGWGWGAPVAAGLGLLAGAVVSAVAAPAYYLGGYGYPAYGYPGYGYGYGPGYAAAYSYDYGYGGPAVYAGYGWGGYSASGYYSPSYTYGTTYARSYYGSPYYRSYGLVRRTGAGPMYARARTVERAYALAPRSHQQQFAQSRATLHRANVAATGHVSRQMANLPRPPVVRAANVKVTPMSRTATTGPSAKPKPNIHSASASAGTVR